MKLPVIVNPTARGGRAGPPREALARAAASRDFELEWWPTQAKGHATELAAKAARDELRAVAVWGGDGTYNEVAQGLVDSETALLPLPGGTTSVLGYELAIPRDPAGALLAQLDGVRKAMAVARTDRGELFLLMLSAGPDSLVLANLPEVFKRRGGKAGIAVQALVELVRARLPRFEVTLGRVRREASWCIVGNSRYYAGPFAATPGADPFAQGLEAVVLTRHGRIAALPFLFGIPTGWHVKMRGVGRWTAMEVKLLGAESIRYQLDGDLAGHLPVSARASGERLWVLVPQAEERVTPVAVSATAG